MRRYFFILILLFGVNMHADLVADGYAEIRENHYTTARVLWSKACNTGNADGCYNLGMMYNYGDGVDQNAHTANRFYLEACNLGNDLACEDYRN